MNFGIVVEDDRDAKVYSELIRKIRDVEAIVPYLCHGDSTLKRQFLKALKSFQWYAPNSPYSINKALVIVDTDCSDSHLWEAELTQIYQQAHLAPGFPVHFHATKCELETWLRADENAINQVSRARGKNKSLGLARIQFETYRDAKELFQKRLSEASLRDTPQVYREVARFADIQRIVARCPLFQQFINKVHAC